VKQKILTILFSSLLLINSGCNNSSSRSQNSNDTEEHQSEDQENGSEDNGYKDGTYCAEVEYYNPSSGTRNTYNLDVEVEDGELTVIHWPNSGWLDNSHFYPKDITDGECEFTSDKGYRYTVTLGELGGCGYTDEYKIRRDVNDEVEATTCPKCGDEKDSYDNYCFYCKRKIEDEKENTCSRCGTIEYGVYGGICSSCEQDEQENDENYDN
jgi:hypothetical protein